jgi:hypothetical protein
MKKILGFLDLISVLSLIFVDYFSLFFLFVFAFYLIIKGFLFVLSGDFISLFDIISGVYFVFVVIGFSYFVLTFIVGIYILQKALLSLFW